MLKKMMKRRIKHMCSDPVQAGREGDAEGGSDDDHENNLVYGLDHSWGLYYTIKMSNKF